MDTVEVMVVLGERVGEIVMDIVGLEVPDMVIDKELLILTVEEIVLDMLRLTDIDRLTEALEVLEIRVAN